MSSAIAWGIEPVSLVTPAEVKELVPFIDESVILGGFYTPSVGVVDSLRAGTLMREQAVADGALTVAAGVEVLGIDVEGGRVQRLRTTEGDIETETVVIACGVWSPKLARMAGAHIPLTPAVHQMIDIGPVPRFEQATRSIEFPIVRDMDTNMYERQDGTSLEIGSYAHRPILYEPEDLPSVEEAALSPTEFPFTQEDFAPQLEHALELMPEIVGDESVGIKYAINGILSLTPDGMPVLGETPEVAGLWSAAAVWVKEGPGVGKGLAEWMVHGESEIDLHSSDVARFHEHHKTSTHIKARTAEGFNKTYGIVHPAEQWASNRDVRLSPFNARERELGAVFFEAAGWERPQWYESNAPLLEEYGDRVGRREAEWDARWWSPIVNAEHLAMRDRAAIFDLSAFAIFDVTGPGALGALQQVSARQVDVPVGRVVYTPWLSPRRRLQVRPHDHAARRRGVPRRHRRSARHVRPQVALRPPARRRLCPARRPDVGVVHARALGAARARHPRERHERRRLPRGFPFATCRTISVGPLEVLASRISYVGDLGWELYVPIEQGARLWDIVWEAGRAHGAVPAGIGVYGTTGRLEKCYRAYGTELESEYTVVEAGMSTPKVKDADFVGKEAHLRHRDEEPAAILCTLTVDDHTSSAGVARYPLGREPLLSRAGEPLVDAKGRRSYVTSAGAAPSLGQYLLMAYLPPEQAIAGTELLVDYLGERYPVSVAVAGATPVFDPENARIRS